MGDVAAIAPRAEQEGPSKREVLDLQAKYGHDLVTYLYKQTNQPSTTFVFRTPSRTEWQVHINNLQQANKKGTSSIVCHEQLLVDTLVYPVQGDAADVPRLRQLFDKKPAVVIPIAEKVAELAGAEEEVNLGKL